MTSHRRSGRISIPQLGLGIVAIAAVTVAVLIGQPGASSPTGDSSGSGGATPSPAATSAPPPAADRKSTSAEASGLASSAPGGAETGTGANRAQDASTGAGDRGVTSAAGAGAPRPGRPPSAQQSGAHRPPGRGSGDLRLPAVDLPSCIVGC
ncbi:conserved exported hypothetical protein [Frankia canadensis]|uniref:Uncharacterized protein n=1 Tax=Frankia canadensis TaxID=1836972 RepID=A0A2I2KT71_9ACTN|nr:hypothetical protein [Frankia canadensis]SNQ48839.1 conserved exported hypothetical protein [Frankia canadensis]SOU56129.1 conserved exported hypothetical protein [Frankia canadensis]